MKHIILLSSIVLFFSCELFSENNEEDSKHIEMTENAYGCGSIQYVLPNVDSTKFLFFDIPIKNPSNGTLVFDLDTISTIQLVEYVSKKSINDLYCNDTMEDVEVSRETQVVSGKLTVEISEYNSEPFFAVFMTQLSFDRIILKDGRIIEGIEGNKIQLGWFPG